jgi:hypothetical protein
MQCAIDDYKVDVLPPKGKPNSRYYVPNGNGTDIDEYITDKSGNFRKVNPVSTISVSYEEITEELVGTIDGSNAIFTTTQNFDPDTTIVFINGVKQKKPTHYNTIGTNVITFSDSPQVGDILEINYVKL